MHELEVILHEYLSFNWDRVEQVLEANEHLLRQDGLACPWKQHASQQVHIHMPLLPQCGRLLPLRCACTLHAMKAVYLAHQVSKEAKIVLISIEDL